jgi:hypothetical protein
MAEICLLTLSGRKSVWNHPNHGGLLGLQKREYLAKTHSAYRAGKEEGMIFKP